MDWPWTAIQSLTSSPGGNLTTSFRSMPELREALACLWRLNFSVPLSKRFFGRNVCKCKRIYIYMNQCKLPWQHTTAEIQEKFMWNPKWQITNKTHKDMYTETDLLQMFTATDNLLANSIRENVSWNFLSKTFCLQWDEQLKARDWVILTSPCSPPKKKKEEKKTHMHTHTRTDCYWNNKRWFTCLIVWFCIHSITSNVLYVFIITMSKWFHYTFTDNT